MHTLLGMEKRRKAILAKFFTFRVMSFGGALVTTFTVFLYILSKSQSLYKLIAQNNLNVKLIAAIFALGVMAISYKSIFKILVKEESSEFVREYKNFYLAGYINSLGYSYSKLDYVNVFDIMKSKLFEPFDRQDGDDLIKGEIDGVSFAFCDLVLQNVREENSLLGMITHSKYETLFEGLFFVASFNKRISSCTFVMSKGRANHPSVKKISMDNAEFNAMFSVYTDDIQNAMYILSPALMERIIKLAKRMKDPVSISFIQEKIFIKIECGRGSFEPDIHTNIVSKNLAPSIKKDIESMLEIVKILRLA